MIKNILLSVACLLVVSCHSEQVSPCYECQLKETFRGVTNTATFEKCGTAYAQAFAQQNTYNTVIMQGKESLTIERVTTCRPK